MKKRNIVRAGAVVLFTAGSSLGLFGCGCGNNDFWDMNYNLNYVVVDENDTHVLHKVDSWSDSESDSLTFKTSCCDNYVWTSANNSVLYKNKPAEHTYDKVCTGLEH